MQAWELVRRLIESVDVAETKNLAERIPQLPSAARLAHGSPREVYDEYIRHHAACFKKKAGGKEAGGKKGGGKKGGKKMEKKGGGKQGGYKEQGQGGHAARGRQGQGQGSWHAAGKG